MSNHLISEVYKRQVGNMARKAVMVLMADKASDDGSGIWTSKQRMADEIGATKQTVISTIKSLIADGLLSESGQRKCANGYTIEYRINVAALRAIPFVKSHAFDRSNSFTGQDASPVNVNDQTGQIPLPHQSNSLTQTLLEPSENLSDASHPQCAPDAHVMDWLRFEAVKAAAVAAAKAKRPPAKPKVDSPTPFRMTSDWKPACLPDTVRELCDQWPDGRLAREVEQFRDYWLDRTEKRPGWDRTFHNRIRDIHDRVMRENRRDHRPASNDQELSNPYARVAVANRAARAADERRQPGGWS